jgi:hypothetical protein
VFTRCETYPHAEECRLKQISYSKNDQHNIAWWQEIQFVVLLP